MKSSSKILILAIFLVFICCVSAASAAENDNVTASGDELAVEEVAADDVIDEQDTLASQEVDVDEKLAGDSPSEYVVWVGTNSTPGGQGTEDDPFSTLDSACGSISEYKEKVTVNINDGNYTIGSILQFNTSNLHINAVGNNVIIKNLYDSSNIKQSFGLINEGNGNFTMSNVIFDGSGWTRYNSATQFFTPFSNGNSNFIKFDNCTFTGFDASKNSRDPNFHKTILPHSAVNGLNNYNTYEFTNCKFINYTSNSPRGIGIAYNCNVTFVNCVFTAEYNEGIGMTNAKEVIFDSCWFGYNNFNDNRMFTSEDSATGEINPRQPMTNGIYKFTRYSVFTISENYLGDNKYEIIGELKWNDTTSDNIGKLGSMTVYLSVNNGNIPKTATLENGIFKVNYTSESDYHEITAVLDHQTIKLNNSINFTLNSPSINYGDNQNVTVSFQNNVTGTVYVIVNNKTYRTYLDDKNSIVVSIEDKLPKGTHEVVVKFESYNDNHDVISLGFNTTTISVAGINDYTFEVSPIDNVFVGDEKTLTITLPDDANGTITVYVNTKEFAAPVSGNTTTLTVNGFVAGNNVINITYNDNVKYESKNIIKNVNASLKPTSLTATDVTTDYKVAKELVVTLTDADDNPLANKTINIVVGTINENLNTTADGQVSVDISNLDSDTYIATISFAGDELYNSSSTTATVVVREDVKTDISIPSLTAGKAATTTIKLPENATGNITVTIDGKITSVVNLTNGSATITIPELSAGKHDVVISYSGDGNYAAFSQNSTVTVKEQAKPTPAPATVKKAKQATKIVAKNKKFKAKTKVKKYTITLKTKAGKAVKKVQVTIKIGKKTFKAKTNNKGKATFKIKKLTKKGKYTATIKFKGNANYKAATKKVKITIKK